MRRASGGRDRRVAALLLGAGTEQVPVIDVAHELDVEEIVAACDRVLGRDP